MRTVYSLLYLPSFFSFLSISNWLSRSLSLAASLSFLLASWLYWVARLAMMFWSFWTCPRKLNQGHWAIMMRPFEYLLLQYKNIPHLFLFLSSFAKSWFWVVAVALSHVGQISLLWTVPADPGGVFKKKMRAFNKMTRLNNLYSVRCLLNLPTPPNFLMGWDINNIDFLAAIFRQ